MKGTLRLQIKSKGRPPMHLEYALIPTPVPGGVRLTDETGEEAILWDAELEAVSTVGGGATPETALLISHLIDQKFGLVN